MIFWAVAPDVINWSMYLWQHRAEFEPVLNRLGEAGQFTEAAIASPDGVVRRIGSSLVFGRADGGEKVLAFIEQTGPQIEAVQGAVADVQFKQQALQFGQHALSTSLNSLHTLSMISLGFTAILPLVLCAQFRALGQRLAAMQKDLKDLVRKVHMMNIANMETGLEHLRLGIEVRDGSPQDVRDHLKKAHDRCLEALKYFGGLLDAELREPKVNRDEVRLLFRYLAVAVGGVVGSHVGLHEDATAMDKINEVEPRLREVAKLVFAQTVGKDPARFLWLPVDQGGVTLEFLVDLFRQARYAGAVEAPQDQSASTWFEKHRQEVFQTKHAWSGRGKDQAIMRRELAEGASIVEEVNRIKGLERLLREVKAEGEQAAVIQSKIREVTRTESASNPYLVWTLS